MIDFHSHILPAIDDGASDVETALEMLRISFLSGIDTVISTSHCYINNDNIDEFLIKRKKAYETLKTAMLKDGGAFPDIRLAAEVAYVPHLSQKKHIKELCIESTDYLLLELPYTKWTNELFEDIYSLTLIGIKPILAHLDRFLYNEKSFQDLLSLDVLCQINADFLLTKKGRINLIKLFKKDAAQILGSDMHNLADRGPNLAESFEIIKHKFGWEYVDYLQNNALKILKNESPLPTYLPEIGLFKRLNL